MNIKIENTVKKETELLCGFVLENSSKVLGLGKLDSKVTSVINQSLNDMKGELGNLITIPLSGGIPSKRILLAGLGKKEKHNRRYNQSYYRKKSHKKHGNIILKKFQYLYLQV